MVPSQQSNDTENERTLEDLLTEGTVHLDELPHMSTLGKQLFVFGAECLMLRLIETGIEPATLELKTLSEKILPSE